MNRFAYVTGTSLIALALSSGIALAQARLDPKALEAACATAAKNEPAAFRPGGHTKMWCAVVDREGKLLAINATDTGGTPQNPQGSDAWRGSIEIAIAKAYTAVAFSSNDLALDSKTIGLVTRPDVPGSGGDPGTDSGAAPLWGLSASNPYRTEFGFGLGGDDGIGTYHHGIITFAGGQPIYSKGGSGGCGGGVLIGAVGVSGDGVDQDDDVAKNTVLNAPISLCTSPAPPPAP